MTIYSVKKGRLFCNSRYKISKDEGSTWSPLHKLYGESVNASHRVTIGNPSPVVVGGRVLMICVRNAQHVLALRSEDAAGLVWPSVATDITDATFGNASYPDGAALACYSGALSANAMSIRRANATLADAKTWCVANSSCAGFTAQTTPPSSSDRSIVVTAAMNRSIGTACQPGAAEVLDVFFKADSASLGVNGDADWSSWLKPHAPRKFATGPPAGIVLASGRILIEYYSMGPTYAGTLISDDGGKTFHPSSNALVAGGEGTLAEAPNGSVIFNSRGTQSNRFQSASTDQGESWSAPRVLSGFGSSAEGAMIRVNGSDLMLFSHGGDINGTGGRWNMTVWASWDSAGTWTSVEQVEPMGNVGDSTVAKIALHTAYSSLVQVSATEALVVWERGPMASRCFPQYPNCSHLAGEYQTLRARRFTLPIKPSN